MVLTEAELQDYIHAMYEQDGDTPTSTDEEYLFRRKLINMGIGYWEKFKGTNWNELYTRLADTAVGLGGDRTVATNDTNSDCPTDFVNTIGYVQLIDASGNATNYTEVKTESEAQLFARSNSDAKVYWITGKPKAYKINWFPTISASQNGFTIDYAYLKQATLLSTTTGVADPSDHQFLIHYVLYWLLGEEKPNKAREHFDIATGYLEDMRKVNNMEKAYQDRGLFDKTEASFGE